MKRLLTLLFLVSTMALFGQVKKPLVIVPDSLTTFGFSLPLGVVIYDKGANNWWELLAPVAGTDSLASASKESAVSSVSDGNGIYTGSDSLSGPTTVTMSTDNLTFSSTGNANLLKIDAVNDRLGVGISPLFALDVKGSIAGTSVIRVASAVHNMTFMPQGSVMSEITTSNIGIQFTVGNKHIRFNSPTASNILMYLNGAATGFDLGSGAGAVVHQFFTEGASIGKVVLNATSQTTGDVNIKGLADASLLYSDASTDRIGIGLTLPLAKLHVMGEGITSATTTFLAENSVGDTLLIIRDDASVALTGNLAKSLTATITASVTQTQGQQPLTTDVNEISVVANANDVVTLPAPPALGSYSITIINNGANTLQIFPASGDDLGAGVDASTTLLAGFIVTFISYNATNWIIKP